jgi:hypothetical protein
MFTDSDGEFLGAIAHLRVVEAKGPPPVLLPRRDPKRRCTSESADNVFEISEMECNDSLVNHN